MTVLKEHTWLEVVSMVRLQELDSKGLNRWDLEVVVRACESKECHLLTGCSGESLVEVEKAREG